MKHKFLPLHIVEIDASQICVLKYRVHPVTLALSYVFANSKYPPDPQMPSSILILQWLKLISPLFTLCKQILKSFFVNKKLCSSFLLCVFFTHCMKKLFVQGFFSYHHHLEAGRERKEFTVTKLLKKTIVFSFHIGLCCGKRTSKLAISQQLSRS